MKYLYATLALCLCLPLQADVQVDEVTVYGDWPVDFLLNPGEFEFSCPGGTLPLCEDANEFHYRGLEIYSCLGDSDPADPRLEGTVWIQINNNYDIDGTGPSWGVFKMVPGDSCDKTSLINPDVYWIGSWEGRREIVSESWVHTIEVVGHGVGGDLEGQKFRATEVLTLYTPEPIPYEFLGLTGPESIIYAEIKSKVK